ncbi:hypothetical protein [Archangium lansingense]|uniref:Uncharacterized protein n=1 Tax=Archangium lansingense TaxID=2995310 RepID=A0ABT4ASK1_9BACT|nr:hypothetical protein [Archangium lansinium]MCY1083782.1 hypothetical protein [Archangium lansinium]
MRKPPELSPYFAPLLADFSQGLVQFSRASVREHMSIAAWMDAMEQEGYESAAEAAARAAWGQAYEARAEAGHVLMERAQILLLLTNLNPSPASA